jgi:DNA polymerase elongation subunit (family B)
MEVPLSAVPTVKFSKEKISLWCDGKNIEIDAPIKPYYYSYKKDLVENVPYTEVRAKSLSDMKERTFYKYEFETREDLTKCRIEGITFEDNIPFIIRNRIDNPDIYRKYPHKKDLVFLFLDIEQYVKKNEMFPTYEDRIISIAWCTNDRKVNCAFLKEDTSSDKKLLERFIDSYKKINPDVIVIFNKKYDIPTILRRCERNNIDTSVFSKNRKKPTFHTGGGVSLEGVLIYDVYDSVASDQALTGNVVNRGLKEVSDYFGFKVKREPLDAKLMHKYVGTKELVEYNQDDVYRTLLLFDVYWDNIEFRANDLGMPLGECLALNITDLGLITIGDMYREHNIIADGKNEDRYPDIFKKDKDTSEGNYEGALVDIYRTGAFFPVYKEDYSSMYPKIMAEFNLSPDTTTFLGFEPKGEFQIIEEKDWFIYHIPDDILKKTMVIQVSKTKNGFLSELVKKFLKERSEYKKLWRETKEKKYRTMSDSRKVKANGGVYGVQGSGKHAFGFVPIAIATTGIGRECAQLLIDILEDLYPKSVIEVDTDGVYFSAQNVNHENIQELFNKKINEKFKKNLNLSIDLDSYPGGYFYLAKNYVLLRDDGELILHGAGMKAKSMSGICKSLIKKIARAKLENKDIQSIIDEYMKLDFPLTAFAMNTTLGRHMSQYKNPTSTLGSRLALIAEQQLGIKPEIGNNYYYIKSIGGYKLLELSDKYMIDENYYRNEIKKIVEMFKEQMITSTVDEWI